MKDSPESESGASRALAELTVRPIGFLRTGKQVKFQTLHQPDEASAEENVLELLPERDLEMGLRDLAGFSRLWLISWFDRNDSWRPLVMPPRGPARRRGVFATRSPHRPNPIGLTAVRLLRIVGRRLILGPCDLMDGTPVLDVKPYLPAYDAFPEELAGWTEAVDGELREPPRFTVTFASLARIQADWLRDQWQVDFRSRLVELLSRDPSVHRGRRIRARGLHLRVAGCGAWRAIFAVEEGTWTVEVQRLEPGYPPRFLADPTRTSILDREAQLAFLARWPEQTISGG
ncbi:MAG: tRNA (N6-threonylcarbamoyladenosine(37)-N6)-methyltransferase TrmO [Verrucomicrobiae bacterium]|nr:tRNA (N6-threonylcarbamoyladenosine(37)-N6)-methyltransferase TrmO [Verrucomicrobiae bacterium]